MAVRRRRHGSSVDYFSNITEVILDIDRLIVAAGRAWTTGAVTAAYDLALKLVREQTTAEFAALLSKIILVGHDRNLQSPFVLADLGSRSIQMLSRGRAT